MLRREHSIEGARSFRLGEVESALTRAIRLQCSQALVVLNNCLPRGCVGAARHAISTARLNAGRGARAGGVNTRCSRRHQSFSTGVGRRTDTFAIDRKRQEAIAGFTRFVAATRQLVCPPTGHHLPLFG